MRWRSPGISKIIRSLSAFSIRACRRIPAMHIAARQMTDGFGGMLSILVKGGFDDAKRLCTRLKVIVPATSLGGVESLAEHRKTVGRTGEPGRRTISSACPSASSMSTT